MTRSRWFTNEERILRGGTHVIPARSSGERWTAEENECLRREVLELIAKFEGRSAAAVLTQISLLQSRYYGDRWPFGPDLSFVTEQPLLESRHGG